MDSTINRAHQHATNLSREKTEAIVDAGVDAGIDAAPDAVVGALASHTGGWVELQRPADPAVRAGQQGFGELYEEPVHHAIGRSRGGLSSKIHQLVDVRGRPLVVLVGPGQANDSPVLPDLLANLLIERCGPGRPRTRPDAVVADKAYSARAHRERLRARGIKAVIPQPSDQIRNRRGSRGGRPPAFDAETYRGRNVVERSFKQWRGLATRYDSRSSTTAPRSYEQSRSGSNTFRDTP